jgi:hypothetical protein
MSEPETWIGNVQEASGYCLRCGLPHAGECKRNTCLNCKVTLDELQAWQAVVDGELVRPLCRGCWTATTAGECKREAK